MNRELMKAYGIKINCKSKSRIEKTTEVEILRNTKNGIRLTFSFRDDVGAKFGNSIIITKPIGSRIYFFKGSEASDPTEARSLGAHKNKGPRLFAYLTDNENIYKDFVGSYPLKFWDEIDGWYISNSDKEDL